ncbi:MAG: DUF951 domain-containing protein [Dehalococcoidia bacterium]|nr:DUF951 domain-containing protein [Dehalococcoidia bacterium]
MVREYSIRGVLRLRKVHPCGSYQWQVVRVGADIGLRCLSCGRRVLMPRSVLEQRLERHQGVPAPAKD